MFSQDVKLRVSANVSVTTNGSFLWNICLERYYLFTKFGKNCEENLAVSIVKGLLRQTLATLKAQKFQNLKVMIQHSLDF